MKNKIKMIEKEDQIKKECYREFFGGNREESSFRKIQPKKSFKEHKEYIGTTKYYEEVLKDIRRLWKPIYEDQRKHVFNVQVESWMTPQKKQQILQHLKESKIEHKVVSEMVTAIETGAIERYVKKDELDLFLKFFVLCDQPPTPLPDMEEDNEGKLEEQIHANSFNLTNRGKYYHNSSWAKVHLKLVHFKHREVFAQYRWHLGKFKEEIYKHDTKLKNENYIQQRIAPFKLSPGEAQLLESYTDKLQKLGILKKWLLQKSRRDYS